MVDLNDNARKNLYCLVVANSNHSALDLIHVNDYQGKLEIDLENQRWKEIGDWKKIGKYSSGCYQVRLVFDWTDFNHFKEALTVTADYHR